MQFVLICVLALLALGVVAALASMFTKGGTDEPVVEAHDCSSCSSVASGRCEGRAKPDALPKMWTMPAATISLGSIAITLIFLVGLISTLHYVSPMG